MEVRHCRHREQRRVRAELADEVAQFEGDVLDGRDRSASVTPCRRGRSRKAHTPNLACETYDSEFSMIVVTTLAWS